MASVAESKSAAIASHHNPQRHDFKCVSSVLNF